MNLPPSRIVALASVALAALFTTNITTAAEAAAEPTPPKLAIGQPAPEFKIRDSAGKEIDLATLTAKGPVLVRLTCGCLGCNKELPYFQELHAAYKDKGLVSLAVFREADVKVEAYVKEKKLDMLYAVDSKGESWKVFQTKTMPSNFLIEKGGRIAAISTGCDPSGLTATRLSEKAATLVGAEKVDPREKVNAQPVPQGK
jgi:peroxiredoxin